MTSASETWRPAQTGGNFRNRIRHPSPDPTMTVSGEDLARYLAWLAKEAREAAAGEEAS